MTVIRGATVVAAVAPDTKSAANRRPKFLVFHTRTSVNGSFNAAFDTDFIDASSWTSFDSWPDMMERAVLGASIVDFSELPTRLMQSRVVVEMFAIEES